MTNQASKQGCHLRGRGGGRQNPPKFLRLQLKLCTHPLPFQARKKISMFICIYSLFLLPENFTHPRRCSASEWRTKNMTRYYQLSHNAPCLFLILSNGKQFYSCSLINHLTMVLHFSAFALLPQQQLTGWVS